ncbi:M2 family metallopeptidase [Hymenobacter busanensis]|uniref:M2 family metallopeptidase n=1 Tax=Hymenobacter busanensis TaxID=2607656 RepID=A0A7L4ZS91_9BACT|nr:M2 family metallopeptidase [Hymenobacter busanensis]KAA9327508.1 M2 family metallopeptidase [Hymenobacter busanensis]QHJ06154.1 peptidase [Hymenobacter busanensis]
MKKHLLPVLAATALLGACAQKASAPAATVTVPPAEPAAQPASLDYSALTNDFLTTYSTEYQRLYTQSSEAEWRSNTHIVPGDTANAAATARANEAFAAFTGSAQNIDELRRLLRHQDQLNPLQVKQLQTALYNAAGSPQTIADVVKRRIKAETQQTEKLYGFTYKYGGKAVTTNDLDELLRKEKNVAKRQQVWEASKAIGPTLKEGLLNLRGLRNQTVQALGYPDYFTYQASDYGMTRDEMMALVRRINDELRPLYRELHTYARYELAKKYGQKQVPDYLPAHWLPNRWGQDWSSMVDVKGLNLDAVLAKKGAEWQVKQAERFYQSLGFPALPATFWEKSSLYPLPAGAAYKKNNHASAWHMNLDQDVRSLMSVEGNTEWYETTHHELGHIYYYLTYTNPDVPVLLRAGANRGYHEAMGSLMGLAATQKPFLAGLGLIDPKTQTDQTQTLLKEALNYVTFIPFASGVMSEWENSFYAENLPQDQLNAKWWALAKQYQGIVPPTARGENYLDPATKTHINDDPAQYYDYALSYVILFQLHDHIAKNILKQDPHATNYYGNQEVGKFLRDIMYPGASADWRQLLREKTGEDLSARAMVDYFQPLMTYLKQQNKGRKYTM